MCRYCGVNGDQCKSNMCSMGITDEEEKKIIVDKHNELRRYLAEGKETRGVNGTEPKAANMNELVWDDQVARVAQNWVDQCATYPHDTNRNMPDG